MSQAWGIATPTSFGAQQASETAQALFQSGIDGFTE
jgi:hypothetical protein